MNRNIIVHPYPEQFITGFRGARYLLDPENNVYTFHKNLSNSVERYVCRQTERRNCSSFAKVKHGMVVSLTEHTHPPSPTKVRVMMEKQAILDSIQTNPEVPTNQLVADLMGPKLKPEEHTLVGHKESFERSIQRKKASILWKTRTPSSFAQLNHLRGTHRETTESERFLLSSLKS